MATSVVLKAQSSFDLLSFKEHEKRTFESTRIKTDYLNDSLYSTTTFNFKVKLRVLSVTPSETTIEWVYTKKSHDHIITKKSPRHFIIANALETLSRKLYAFETLKIIYSVDASGSFKELKNLKEVKQYVSDVINATIAEKTSDKNFIGAIEQFRPALLADDYLTYSFVQDIHLYHQLNAMEITLDKQVYEIELPNPLNGQPTPGTLTVEGKEHEHQSYEYTMRQEIDQEKLTKTVNDKIKDTYDKIGESERVTPKINYECTYHYFITQGMVKKANQVKTVSSGESTIVEEFKIE